MTNTSKGKYYGLDINNAELKSNLIINDIEEKEYDISIIKNFNVTKRKANDIPDLSQECYPKVIFTEDNNTNRIKILSDVLVFNINNERNKLKWTEPCENFVEYNIEALELYNYINEFRYDLDGNLTYPKITYGNSSDQFVLRHHSDKPELEGYTINELLLYCSSCNRSQATLGVKLLTNVLNNRFNKQIISNNYTSKYMNNNCGGFGVGLMEFDNYLFQKVLIHERIMHLLIMSDNEAKMQFIQLLSILFGYRNNTFNEHFLEYFDNYDYITLNSNKSSIVENKYLFYNGVKEIGKQTSKRSLLRSEEIIDCILFNKPFDFSSRCFIASHNNSNTLEITINNLTEEDEKLLRTQDPLLSLLLWDQQDDNFLLIDILFYGLINYNDNTVLISICWLLFQLIKHSEYIQSIIYLYLLKMQSTIEDKSHNLANYTIFGILLDSLFSKILIFYDTNTHDAKLEELIIINLTLLKEILINLQIDDITSILGVDELSKLINIVLDLFMKNKLVNLNLLNLVLEFKLFTYDEIDNANPYISVIIQYTEEKIKSDFITCENFYEQFIISLLKAHRIIYNVAKNSSHNQICINDKIYTFNMSDIASLTSYCVNEFKYNSATYPYYLSIFNDILECKELNNNPTIRKDKVNYIIKHLNKYIADFNSMQIDFNSDRFINNYCQHERTLKYETYDNNHYFWLESYYNIALLLLKCADNKLGIKKFYDSAIEITNNISKSVTLINIYSTNNIDTALSDNICHILPYFELNSLVEFIIEFAKLNKIIFSRSEYINLLSSTSKINTFKKIVPNILYNITNAKQNYEELCKLLNGNKSHVEQVNRMYTYCNVNPKTLFTTSDLPIKLLYVNGITNKSADEFTIDWINIFLDNANDINTLVFMLINVCDLVCKENSYYIHEDLAKLYHKTLTHIAILQRLSLDYILCKLNEIIQNECINQFATRLQQQLLPTITNSISNNQSIILAGFTLANIKFLQDNGSKNIVKNQLNVIISKCINNGLIENSYLSMYKKLQTNVDGG